jgi:iron complex outermembrane receptor protein
VRLGYNSENINVHAHWMNRSVQDTMWLLVPGAPLLDDSEDFLVDAQHNFYISEDIHVVWGISQQFQMIRTSGTSIPDDVDADYTGIYGQIEWQLNDIFKAVASARFDRASIHDPQCSPRIALVATPIKDQTFRLSFGRSFQRPNYSELFRLTPDAPAFAQNVQGPPRPALLGIDQIIADSIASLSGQAAPDIALNLDATRARAIGNDDLSVEQNIGLEFGYKGILSEKLFVTADVYYNKLTDFITNFLPGVNNEYRAWQPNLEGNLAQYNDLAYDIVMSQLSPRDQQRLAVVDGVPTFVVSNTNVGEVDQYGFDVGVNYYITNELLLGANYSYYDFEVVEANITQPLLPNTSPHRFNASATYEKQGVWDASISFHYSDGFDWVAGTYVGEVPSYNFTNISAGVMIMDGLRFGINVFNVFNQEF